MDKQAIGRKIFAYREKHNLTQKELADKLYVSDKTISKWERGVCYPDIEVMENLAETIGVSLAQLLDIENKSVDNAIKEFSVISAEEKNSLKKEIKKVVVLDIIILLIIFLAEIIVSRILHLRGIDGGLLGSLTLGMCGFIGAAIGSMFWILRKTKLF